MVDDILCNLIKKRPLVHNITNYVTATDCANITLAVGASPIMADEPLEVCEVTQIADGLVINTGTISENRAKAILLSAKTAKEKGIPVVLDPVGAGVSKYRSDVIRKIITEATPDIIRLNVSELKSICLDIKNISGVDGAAVSDMDSIISLAKQLALKIGAIIGVSGVSDIVTDGERVTILETGHKMMRKITGAGCMLSSVVGAYAVANTNDLYGAVVSAFDIFGKCGETAFTDGIGIGTYKTNFFDEISKAHMEELLN